MEVDLRAGKDVCVQHEADLNARHAVGGARVKCDRREGHHLRGAHGRIGLDGLGIDQGLKF